MDKTTLENEDVKAALAGYIKIKFQAEEPDKPPAKDLMRRFEAVGLPTYVILRPAQDLDSDRDTPDASRMDRVL